MKCLMVLHLHFMTYVRCSIRSWYMDHFKTRNIFYCFFAFWPSPFSLFSPSQIQFLFIFFSAGCVFSQFFLKIGATLIPNWGWWDQGFFFFFSLFDASVTIGLIIAWMRTWRSSCCVTGHCFAALLRVWGYECRLWFVVAVVVLSFPPFPSFSKFRFKGLRTSGWGCCQSWVLKLLIL